MSAYNKRPTDEYRQRSDGKRYLRRLLDFEKEVNKLVYESVFEVQAVPFTYGAYAPRVSVSIINDILSNLGPPHGLEILSRLTPPSLPKIPVAPESLGTYHDMCRDAVGKLKTTLSTLNAEFYEVFANDSKSAAALRQEYERSHPGSVERLTLLSLQHHFLPPILKGPVTVNYDDSARILLCTIEVPDCSRLRFFDPKRVRSVCDVEGAKKKKISEAVLSSLCIRSAYLAAHSDSACRVDTVTVNARQSWFDTATGTACEGIIASLQATKHELLELEPSRVDPKACFRSLRGIVTPSIEHVSAIRPIFIMDTADRRIVENRDVDSQMQVEMNLAAMPWDDFEHLVRQLFEWEFGRNGIEVKVTRASRDRGVDAIMFDPDPLRGGKFVLQAKRYTRPVDVSAVRDLYGTVVNEGANRGILVTTSSYGPDSYEFAKDKPISLVDGPNLLAILRRHGRKYRIDLAEARQMEH